MHNNLLHIEISSWDHLFLLLKTRDLTASGAANSPLQVTRGRNAFTVSVRSVDIDTFMNIRNTLLVLLEIT